MMCAVRGRNKPCEGKRGGYVQVLELNRARVCNSLTTVEKDNYVYETEDTSGNEQRVH